MSTGNIFYSSHKSTPPAAVPGSASPTAGVVFVLYYVYIVFILSSTLVNLFTVVLLHFYIRDGGGQEQEGK
jgi:hypothetical protein